MRSRMIFYLAGIALSVLLPELLPLLVLVFLCLAGFFLYLFCRTTFPNLAIFFLLGLLLGSLWGHWQISHRLADEQARSDWYVEGLITGIPSIKKDVIRFNLEPQIITPHNDAEPVPRLRTLRLSWYEPKSTLLPGQTVKLDVRLKPPHSMLNPKGMDYERWALIRGIDATGYVRRFIEAGSVDQWSISGVRNWVNQLIQTTYLDERNQALSMAIITGSRTLLSDQDWDNLKRTGTTHLAVISGLHIGFIALLGWWVVKGISWVFRVKENRLALCLFPLFLAALYMLLAGAQVPVQRAFIMLLVLLLSGYKLVVIDPWDRWLLALVAVLSFSPLALYETGFWLSFAAVALLIHLARMDFSKWKLFKLQWLLLLGMLPLYSVFFASVSLVAPLVNLVLIPLMSLVVPLVFIDLFLGQLSLSFLHPVVDLLLDLFWWVVDVAAQPEWVYQATEYSKGVILGFSILGGIILILPFNAVSKAVGLCCLLPMFVQERPQVNEDQEFSAWIYDVGQGLSVLIKVNEYYLLYDTGPGYRNGSAFPRQILPHLNSLGVEQLNAVVLSHNDTDHVGGLDDLLKNLKTQQFYSSYPLKNKGALLSDITRCEEGMSWDIDGVSFRFLLGTEGKNDNEKSCVLLVNNHDCSLLIPGDIGASTESRLIPQRAPLTWLVAAHHGSRYSTSNFFLRQWQPENIVYSAGYANHFGHPHPDVIARANARSVVQYQTAKQGAVMLEASKANGCTVNTIREDNKRFWR